MDGFYDSLPPKPAIFCNERFMAARHEEECYKNNVFNYSLVCKGLPNNDAGVAMGTVVQEIDGRELVSKPAMSLKKISGGYRRTNECKRWHQDGPIIFEGKSRNAELPASQFFGARSVTLWRHVLKNRGRNYFRPHSNAATNRTTTRKKKAACAKVKNKCSY